MKSIRPSISIIVAAGLAAVSAVTSATAQQPRARDGQHDFDWEIGTWETQVRVLGNPLTGAAPDWAEFRGTSVVRPILSARANSVELSVSGDKGQIEGVALRLYNPKTRQWNINYASIRGGILTAPIYGAFDGKGRGEFYGQDMLDGRAIQVRFVITNVSTSEARFEQSYSADGGKSWETNWVAIDRRRSN